MPLEEIDELPERVAPANTLTALVPLMMPLTISSPPFTVVTSGSATVMPPGTISATVTAAPVKAQGEAGIARRQDGKLDLVFRGVPGQLYRVERSVDLQSWSLLQTVAPGDDGNLPFTDPAPPAGQAFYRIRPTNP